MKLEKILESDNLAPELSFERRNEIAQQVIEDFQKDKISRSEWERTYEDANKLALQMVEEKSTPWQGASNVKFPLLTIAATQFNARAYDWMIGDGQVVKPIVLGAEDEGGLKRAQADRKSKYQNYQLTQEDECWEEDTDTLTMVLPIAGSCFRRTYYCPTSLKIKSELVLPSQLVVNYWASSIKDTTKTMILRWDMRKVQSKMRAGVWIEYKEEDLGAPSPLDDDTTEGADQRSGKSSPGNDDWRATRPILQQYTFLDLDNDGYAEPYIVTVDLTSGKLFRIVANFIEDGIRRTTDAKIRDEAVALIEIKEAPETPEDAQARGLPPTAVRTMADKMAAAQQALMRQEELRRKGRIYEIEADEEFTVYKFLPNPDGSSIYGLGFGALQGPINHSVNTLINQLIDSGTLQNSSSGFIGRGARTKRGSLKVRPFEWKPLNIPGDDLRKNIVPLPINSPSPVLFQLLGLLIDYSNRISSVTDTMSGDMPGQNTPATVAMASLEQGMKVFSGIFKRILRALSTELGRRYKLNHTYLDERQYIDVVGGTLEVVRSEWASAKDLVPTADIAEIHDAVKMVRAQFLSERAQTTGMYDAVQVEKRLHRSMRIENSQEVFPTKMEPIMDEEGNQVGVQEVAAIQPGPSPDMMKAQMGQFESQSRHAEREARAARDDQLAVASMMETEANIRKMATGDEKVAVDTILAQVEAMRKNFEAQTARMKVSADERKDGDSGED